MRSLLEKRIASCETRERNEEHRELLMLKLTELLTTEGVLKGRTNASVQFSKNEVVEVRRCIPVSRHYDHGRI